MIYALCGKSGSGKTTVLTMLSNIISARVLVTYTTRPRRPHELAYNEYYFVNEEDFKGDLKRENILEVRKYNTAEGEWYYYTKKSSIEEDKDYIVVATPEMIKSYKESGYEVTSIFISVPESVRILRLVDREESTSRHAYSEMYRRLLADEDDFKNCGELPNLRIVNGDRQRRDVAMEVKAIIEEGGK